MSIYAIDKEAIDTNRYTNTIDKYKISETIRKDKTLEWFNYHSGPCIGKVFKLLAKLSRKTNATLETTSTSLIDYYVTSVIL